MSDYNSRWAEFEKYHLPKLRKEAQVKFSGFLDEIVKIAEANR